MAKAMPEPKTDKIPRWQLAVDYVETCNCNFGCPCNFSGYPTDGFCEALVAYHIRDGRFGKVKLDNLDVVYAAAWPKAIHQGGGTLRLYFSDGASPEQRDALTRIFAGKAKGSGPFELFAGTMATIEEPVADVVGDQRLAEAVGRIPAEVARTAEVAVARLDVVDAHLPAGDLLPRLLLHRLLRHSYLLLPQATMRARPTATSAPPARRPIRRPAGSTFSSAMSTLRPTIQARFIIPTTSSTTIRDAQHPAQ